MYLNSHDMSFMGRTAARMVGLPVSDRVFKVSHLPTALVNVGEDVEIQVEYSRPFFAKDARIELSGSKNVAFSGDELSLDDRTGVVTIRFQIREQGYNTIKLTVLGEYRDELVREHSSIYVGSRGEPAGRPVTDDWSSPR
jgi:hypothetical protein